MSSVGSEKIAFVSNTSWSVYNFRIDIIRYLQAQGHEVYVIAPKDTYSNKLIAEGVHFLPIRLNNYGINPLHDIRYSWALFSNYRQFRFDRIYHYTIKPNIYGSIAASLAKIKQSVIVVTGLGRMFLFKSVISNLLSKYLYRLACNRADKVWFLNNHDRSVFITKKICPENKTHVLPSEGINTQKFRPVPKKENQLIRFLFAGRLIRPKGIYQYIEAASIIRKCYPNTRFEILGFIDQSNPESIHYEEILNWQSAGIIRYLGSTEDVRPYIQRADCLVFPSFYQEGLSRILLEAASMATPIITTDQVGCRDVIQENTTGFLCEPNNIDDLIKQLEKFLSLDYEDKIAMGLNARKFVKEQYDIELIKPYYSNSDSPKSKQLVQTSPQ